MSPRQVFPRVLRSVLHWRFWTGAAWAAVLISLTNHWFDFWSFGMPLSLYAWSRTAQIVLSSETAPRPRLRNLWAYLVPPLPFWTINIGALFLIVPLTILITAIPSFWPQTPLRAFLWGPHHSQHFMEILIAIGILWAPFLAIRTLAQALVTPDDLWTCFIHSFRRDGLRPVLAWGYSVTLGDTILLFGLHHAVLHHPAWSIPLDGLMGAILILTAEIFLMIASKSTSMVVTDFPRAPMPY